MEKIEGKETARAFIEAMRAERIEWTTYHIAAAGQVVLTERLDEFDLADGKKISLPVMGTFEIEEGKIKAWRDYFDLNTYMSQLGA
jgi:limonene-1,2-epoxide hydrolase